MRRRRHSATLVIFLVLGMWLASWGHDLFEAADHHHAPEKPVFTLLVKSQTQLAIVAPELLIHPLVVLTCSAIMEHPQEIVAPRDDGPPTHPDLPPGPSRRGPPVLS